MRGAANFELTGQHNGAAAAICATTARLFSQIFLPTHGDSRVAIGRRPSARSHFAHIRSALRAASAHFAIAPDTSRLIS